MPLNWFWSVVFLYSRRLAGAILLVGAALLVTVLIWPVVRPLASPLFLLAIVLSAWWGGIGSGVVSTVLSGLVIDYVFIPPKGALGGSREDLSRLIILTLEGVLISWLTSSRRKVTEAVELAHVRLQTLTDHQQTLREEERGRIAREVHDELGQSLTALKMDIHWLNEELSAEPDTMARAAASHKLQDLLKLVDGTISSVRRIATELRPAILDDLGLSAAIEWQAQEFQRSTKIPCKLSSTEPEIAIDNIAATSTFRIFQEALTNITRHAKARHVTVDLRCQANDLLLRIEDDGRGITEKDLVSGDSLGILGMKERARLAGGSVEFAGTNAGTVVRLRLPLLHPKRTANHSSGGSHD